MHLIKILFSRNHFLGMIPHISTAWSVPSKTNGWGHVQTFHVNFPTETSVVSPPKTETDCFHAGVEWEGAGVGWEGSPASWVYTAPLKISELTPKTQTDLVWTAIPAKDSSSLSLLVNTALGLLLFKSHYCFQCLSFLQILYNRKIYSGYNYFLRVDDNHTIMLQ